MTCSVDRCADRAVGRGFCNRHLKRVRRYGSPDLPTEADRFWSKVDKTDACWLWTGARKTTGYGNVGRGHQTLLAHRLAYELLVGPIPDGLQIDHLCRVRHCVNPAHMELVTNAVNTRRQGWSDERRTAAANRTKARIGWHHSEETKRKISDAKRGIAA